ncbi:hypothetical protein LguiB_001983 [Lonicera macranthoides]
MIKCSKTLLEFGIRTAMAVTTVILYVMSIALYYYPYSLKPKLYNLRIFFLSRFNLCLKLLIF